MDCNVEVYFQAAFAAVRHGTADFRFVTSRVVETQIATLHLDVSSIFTYFDSRLSALASKRSVKTYSDPIGTGGALSP